MAIINSFTETSEIQTWKNWNNGPHETCNTNHEYNAAWKKKFKHKPCLNRQKIKLCNKIDSNIIKFENLVHASDRDGTVPYDHVMISIKHVISTKQQQLVVSIWIPLVPTKLHKIKTTATNAIIAVI